MAEVGNINNGQADVNVKINNKSSEGTQNNNIKLGRKRKNFSKSTIKKILAIILAVVAFIIIITAAWKQQLLEVTSGSINEDNNKTIIA